MCLRSSREHGACENFRRYCEISCNGIQTCLDLGNCYFWNQLDYIECVPVLGDALCWEYRDQRTIMCNEQCKKWWYVLKDNLYVFKYYFNDIIMFEYSPNKKSSCIKAENFSLRFIYSYINPLVGKDLDRVSWT